MKPEIFKDLNLNHIGIIIPKNKINFIESKTRKRFIQDNIQGVSVFNHLCFDIKNIKEMKELHSKIIKNRLGLRLTLPEPSPTKQCNIVTFYKLYGLGIFEFNILE